MAGSLRPNVNLSDDRGPGVNTSISIVSVLAGIALIGRLLSRRLKKIPLSASDHTLVLGWLMGCGVTICVYMCKSSLQQSNRGISVLPLSFIDRYSPTVGVHFGLGKHLEAVPFENIIKLLKVRIQNILL